MLRPGLKSTQSRTKNATGDVTGATVNNDQPGLERDGGKLPNRIRAVKRAAADLLAADRLLGNTGLTLVSHNVDSAMGKKLGE